MKDKVCRFYGDAEGSTLTEAYWGAKGVCEKERENCEISQKYENTLNEHVCEYVHLGGHTFSGTRTGCEFRSNLVIAEDCEVNYCQQYTGDQLCTYQEVEVAPTGIVKFKGFGDCSTTDPGVTVLFECHFSRDDLSSFILDWDAYGCERPYEENSG